jgi:hypothetical protein
MTQSSDPTVTRVATSDDLAACFQTLNGTLVLLTLQYGAATAIAALTELAGCTTCAVKDARREHIRTLIHTVGRSENRVQQHRDAERPKSGETAPDDDAYESV